MPRRMSSCLRCCAVSPNPSAGECRAAADPARAGKTPETYACPAFRRGTTARGHRPCILDPPKILFADEPTGNLDRRTGDKIADLLFSLNRDYGTTLILVTHDLTLAARCQRRLKLSDGKLEELA